MECKQDKNTEDNTVDNVDRKGNTNTDKLLIKCQQEMKDAQSTLVSKKFLVEVKSIKRLLSGKFQSFLLTAWSTTICAVH